MFNISPKHKKNINKIFPFGIICLIFGVIWSLLEGSLFGNLDHYPATGIPYEFSLSIITDCFA